jgi:tripartite-type tricarboxylate transporter receptor subunit TctC
MKRRSILKLALASTAGAWAARGYAAGGMQDKPITLVVPFAPGGGSDIMARALAQLLGAGMGMTTVVENRPGASGLVATRYVKGSAPDCKTLLIADMGFCANPRLFPNADYGVADFTPVAAVASVSSVLVVGAKSPANSLADLCKAGKAHPGALNMASGGAGGAAHLVGCLFSSEAGFQPTHVPYRGMGPAMTDIIGGQVDFLIATTPIALPNVKAGSAKALAVASAQRLPLLPDVPTFGEAGYPAVMADNIYGIVAPARADAGLVAKLHEAINSIIKTSDYRIKLEALAAEPLALDTPAMYGEVVKREAARWAKVIADNKITVT